MEPMVPEEASKALEDEVVTLIAEANQLAGRIHPILRDSIGDLVRSMNCYYSNLIDATTHIRVTLIVRLPTTFRPNPSVANSSRKRWRTSTSSASSIQAETLMCGQLQPHMRHGCTRNSARICRRKCSGSSIREQAKNCR